MVLVVLWLIFAIMVALFAKSKGHSGILYFFISVVLSPLIGFIIALVISPGVEKIEEKALSTGSMKKCPNCAELVKAEAKVCKHCSGELIIE